MPTISTLQAPRHTYSDIADFQDDFIARGLSDGLPLVPPTPERVAEFLERVGLPPDYELGIVTTRDIPIVAEHVAISAVMAGCKVEYMPVVLAGARALLRPEANLHCVSATLGGAQQVFIVNGPVRDKLDINYGLGCFGPGWRANATIGRGLRLLVRNAAFSIPGQMDRAILSSPGRYSFCFGENQEASPWEPYHVHRGFAATDSTITLYSAMTPAEKFIQVDNPRQQLDELAELLFVDSALWVPVSGFDDHADLVLAVSADTAELYRRERLTRQDAQEHLWNKLKGTLGRHNAGVGHPLRLRRPEDIHFIVAGGKGVRSIVYFTTHCATLVTERIDD